MRIKYKNFATNEGKLHLTIPNYKANKSILITVDESVQKVGAELIKERKSSISYQPQDIIDLEVHAMDHLFDYESIEACEKAI